ncbi:phospholipase D family protein [Geminicoccus roseus]|uniref:phospholipase D family protein n=1 Tax=Geminicoccus roseus TaxID=404900 RepID=UPI000429CA6F|nr:phospholipase D family protein [Geminicoccus roseus]
MQPLLVLLIVVACFVAASFLAVWSYGRFARRARGTPTTALPVQDDATPLDRLLAPLLADHPGQSGLLLVEDNLDAFAVRARSARMAGRSLDLQYYFWEHGLTGRLLSQELLDAADRGVRVRLLIDDINTRGRDKTYRALDHHPNISVRLFNPARNRSDQVRRGIEMILRAFRITRRMHNKAWIVDGRLAVVGGRNIGDAYFDADEEANFRDLDVVMVGDAVAQAEHVFDAFWNSDVSIPLTAFAYPRKVGLDYARSRLARTSADQRCRPYQERAALALGDLMDGARQLRWTEHARILWDPPEKAAGSGQQNWLMHAIRPEILAARRCLEIISPYFIPGEAFMRELARMAKGGVDIGVLTNSLAATDVAAVHGAYMRCRYPLAAAGVRLYELKPYQHRPNISLFGSSRASLHTKAFTVDEHTGFIGSMNFDPRSRSLNCEMGVLFTEPELVAQVRANFADETSPEKSYQVQADSGVLVWQDRAAALPQTLRAEPEASLSRRLLARLISILPVQSQL